MNRHDKESVINSLKDDFSKSQAAFLVGYKGITVSQMQELRKELRNQGATIKVAKVTLMKRAVSDLSERELSNYLKDQVAIVFAHNESPAIAKVLHDFSKKHQQLNLVAGCLDAKVINQAGIVTLATLPSKDVLRAQVCSALQSPIVGCVRVANMLLLQLVLVLKQIESQRASQ